MITGCSVRVENCNDWLIAGSDFMLKFEFNDDFDVGQQIDGDDDWGESIDENTLLWCRMERDKIIKPHVAFVLATVW